MAYKSFLSATSKPSQDEPLDLTDISKKHHLRTPHSDVPVDFTQVGSAICFLSIFARYTSTVLTILPILNTWTYAFSILKTNTIYVQMNSLLGIIFIENKLCILYLIYNKL